MNTTINFITLWAMDRCIIPKDVADHFIVKSHFILNRALPSAFDFLPSRVQLENHCPSYLLFLKIAINRLGILLWLASFCFTRDFLTRTYGHFYTHRASMLTYKSPISCRLRNSPCSSRTLMNRLINPTGLASEDLAPTPSI